MISDYSWRTLGVGYLTERNRPRTARMADACGDGASEFLRKTELGNEVDSAGEAREPRPSD